METKSPREVAALLDVDEVTIRRLRRKAGLPERQRGQGYTLDEITLLRAQQRYRVHPAAPPTSGSPDGRTDIAPLTSEMPASASTMAARHEPLLSPSSWDTSLKVEAALAPLSEQLADIARQNDRIIAQNERIEQALGAMTAKLEEMAGTAPSASHARPAPRTQQKQVRGPSVQAVPQDLPPGTVTLAVFAASTHANLGTLKSRLKPYVNAEIRLETTALETGAEDGRKTHYLTPEQQRKALLQWHLHWFPHSEHPLCPEPHKAE